MNTGNYQTNTACKMLRMTDTIIRKRIIVLGDG